MYWLDHNEKVLAWGSEIVIIPYLNPVDDQVHRYIIDFWFHTAEWGGLLVEVKPQGQCLPPKRGKGRKKMVVEAQQRTYDVNTAKWQAAEQYAKANGWTFLVWDEVKLRSLGVVIPATRG